MRRAIVLLLAAACSEEPGAPPAAAPWDDDRGRLAHCDFEQAPATAPAPAPIPGPLRAGYASAVLRLPFGTPLGAYGARIEALGQAQPADARAKRWATGMTPSVGAHDALRAEALALEAGERPLLIVRVDAPFVVENALFELERAVAPDGSMRGRILLSASHSHSAWGGWLPSVHLSAGADKPLATLFERAVAAMRDAAHDALSRMEPARIGLALDADFDPDDRVSSDRRDANDALLGPDGNTAGADKDRHAWALRVDRAGGEPLVALVDLPIHGTVGEGANPLASTDVPGGIARALEDSLGYPVMHLQGASGDIRPASAGGRAACPDDTRCLDVPRMEILGARAAELLAPLVAGIETAPETAFELVTRSFAIGRGGVVARPDGRQLYYLPPHPDYEPDRLLFEDDGSARSPFDEFNTPYGAGLCGIEGGVTFAPLGGVAGLPPYAMCIDLDGGAEVILSVFDFPVPTLPTCDSVRATGAALRIAGLPGGDWLLVAIPGEPTAPFASYLRARSPAGAERTLLVGYADDYAGYMLTAEDWLSGGYECSTNIWGPREGEQVLEALVAITEAAWSPELDDPEEGSSRFDAWTFPPAAAVDAIETSDHGTALGDGAGLFWPDAVSAPLTGSAVPRGVGAARFAWNGGDPAVDYPDVVVEREVAPGRFEPLVDALGRAAGSERGAVVLSYTPEPLEAAAPSRHRYAAVWQTAAPEPFSLAKPLRPFSLPLGRYRLAVRGSALGAAGVESYALHSPVFELIAAPLAPGSSAEKAAGGIAIRALLGPAPGLRALRDGVGDGEIPLPGPWQVIVTFDDATTTTAEVLPVEDMATVPLSATDLARAVSVEVRDPLGNGGPLAVR